ncbi:glycoside hydrolase family 27 protein [Mucilaginibacter sp. UR6-11]|uniref:glycoside hydrolase family 27 protein n=1 Tax=Mucilaginibacter sp. UR6-11 TaxID=1435644 RepID=UPI001E381B1D|nr:glycoside hydrolase family 27 protein [Mucilaginibacter sp. UR6-11]MCC8426523.1 glycoside hydrolase family 27 protein [Mucilaginibacter sp. UR6-11]
MRKTIVALALTACVALSANAQDKPITTAPPMGWMSWFPFIDKIDEKKIMEVADAMVKSGLRDAGYKLLQLDDGWMAAKRDKEARQYADTSRFPHGMKYLADYLHARGLKIGIYSSNGMQTCAGYPGSYNHEELDANTYAAWGIDYLKYDACGEKEKHTDRELHTRMSKALKATGRPIMFEICIFSSGQTHLWGAEIADMWRTGGDIVKFIDKNPEVTYKNWYENLNQVVGKENYAGNGHWNDPDNLIVDYPRNNKQTYDEQKAQFSLWSIVSAPLTLGNDVRNMSAQTKAILMNKEIIAVDQDKAGKPGTRVLADEQKEIWIKPLNDGTKAVVIFNKENTNAMLTLNLKAIGIAGKTMVRDLWEHAGKGTFTNTYTAKVAPHGVIMIKLTELK